jgi:reactive chlorine resistance protein C
MNTQIKQALGPESQIQHSKLDWLDAISGVTLRYGIVLILVWIGSMKFTAYESEGIRPFVENSPPFAWTYSVFGIQGMSNILGVIEITIGLLIAFRPWAPKNSAVASLAAAGMFLSTISFLATTPQAWLPDTGPLAIHTRPCC